MTLNVPKQMSICLPWIYYLAVVAYRVLARGLVSLKRWDVRILQVTVSFNFIFHPFNLNGTCIFFIVGILLFIFIHARHVSVLFSCFSARLHKHVVFHCCCWFKDDAQIQYEMFDCTWQTTCGCLIKTRISWYRQQFHCAISHAWCSNRYSLRAPPTHWKRFVKTAWDHPSAQACNDKPSHTKCTR